VPYHDVLAGLRALFLEKPAARSHWGALLQRRAPGLSPSEREALLALPEDRLDVYVNLVRDNQAAMLRFVAPATIEVLAKFCGAAEADVARATLLETPRRTGRLRELVARLVEHLRGPGAAWVAACPPVLDLARLEQVQTEVFYAPDDEGALPPPAFAERVASGTLDDVLALRWAPSASLRVFESEHDVLAWRTERYATGAWGAPPPRLADPVEVICARDPATLQGEWHRLEPRVLDLVRPDVEGGTVEDLAMGWVEATGSDGEDPATAGRFVDALAAFVRSGAIAVRTAP